MHSSRATFSGGSGRHLQRLGLTLLPASFVAASCSSVGAAPSSGYLDRAALEDPATCGQCHPDAYRDWSGSMHAYAADDPVFRAMNARGQRETNGALGTFCVNCHAPMAVRDGVTADGLNLDALPSGKRGVTCFFCHSVSSVTGRHNNPLQLATDLVVRGPIADPMPTMAHGAVYSPLHDGSQAASASLCGSCHDVQTGHGANIERTYAEWQASVFSQVPAGLTCGECHMPESTTQVPIATTPGAKLRTEHSHSWFGVDVALAPFPQADAQAAGVQGFLGTTIQAALCVAPAGNTSTLRVILDNVAAGHGFPSGASQDRRLWVEVVASLGGATIYQSGAIAEGASVVENADPDLWLLRDCMLDDGQSPVNMFWNAYSDLGNALPALATFDATDPRYYQTHIVESYPGDAGVILGIPDSVKLRIRLEPIGLDVLDDLVSTGDLDASVRASATAETLVTLEWTSATATDQYIDNRTVVVCVTNGLNVQSDKVLAVSTRSCTP